MAEESLLVVLIRAKLGRIFQGGMKMSNLSDKIPYFGTQFGFLIHGDITGQLLSCAFLPLFKGGFKDPTKIDSYRAIAGSSQLLKLFENTVLLLWGHLLVSDSLQFGYKAKTSTTHCTWLVTEVVRDVERRDQSHCDSP